MKSWIPTLVILALISLVPPAVIGVLALAALGGIAGHAATRALIKRLQKPAAPVAHRHAGKVIPFRKVA